MAGTQSLYRKYRPQVFSQLVGQSHVSSALMNSVRDNRVGHAYLFSGPRGTGKTTTARILAKALNCLSVTPVGEPCDACENCTSIAAGTFPDLFELDAASNNSVTDIRSLIERVNLGMAPNSRTKVYIIDEVHMLSSSSNAAAPSALLKTLEEPPPHVVFVLATTNPEKVLATIRSRTQQFLFSLLMLSELEEHLKWVLRAEEIAFEDDAVSTLARRASGSARDALSLLDQALANFPGGLRADAVESLFGGAPFDARLAILTSIVDGDVAAGFVGLNNMIESGFEARRIAEDLLRTLRDAFLLNAAQGKVAIDATVDEAEALRSVAAQMGTAKVVRGLEALGQAIVDMRGTDAADPRLVLEIALLRLSSSELTSQSRGNNPAPGESNPGGGGAKGARAALGAVRKSTPKAEKVAVQTKPVTTPDAPASPIAEAQPISIDDVILAWAKVVPGLSMASRSAIAEAQPISIEDDVVVFAVAPALVEAAKPRFKKEAAHIREGLASHVGKVLRFKVVASEDLTPRDTDVDLTTARELPEDLHTHDVTEATDAPPAEHDPILKLINQFGAEIVEEKIDE